MKLTACRTGAAAALAALFAFLAVPTARAQAPDSLTLQAPTNVKVWSSYSTQSKRFLVWLTWKDSPDNISAFIGQPDTTGWAAGTPPALMSIPTISGAYAGDIDRTVAAHSNGNGVVGVDSLAIIYEVRHEEYYSGRIDIGPTYIPGTPMPMTFRDQRNGAAIDFGLKVAFSAGRFSKSGTFTVGLEDFEGFHIWRGVKPDGSDLQVIGELSKEEAHRGRKTGGSLPDSVYFYEVIPTLRASAPWISTFGPIFCLGSRIDLPLGPSDYFWFDCNGTNGFTYYYAVTTFDRGYTATSGTQGLFKFDNCQVAEGRPYTCQGQMKSVALTVPAQSDLYKVYVVPNPVRTGSSRLITDNYHNFPDEYARFVNVPAHCTIKIYTVSGDLVWENDHTDGTGNVAWDTRNLENEQVASGVYVYRIENGSDSVYGRIVVIR